MTIPEWRRYDSEDTRVLSMSRDRGRVVLFATTPAFLERPEAPRLAIDVARDWAAYGEQVILADGCFEAPVLHEVVGLPNDQGLTDVLFVGLSVQDVVQPGGRARFHLLTTGIVPGNRELTIGHERWTRFNAEIHRDGLTLAVLTPVDSELGRRVLMSCTDIIVLAEELEDITHLFPSGETRVREVLGPPDLGSRPGAATEETPAVAGVAPTPVKAAGTTKKKRRTLFSAEDLAPGLEEPMAAAPAPVGAPEPEPAAVPDPQVDAFEPEPEPEPEMPPEPAPLEPEPEPVVAEEPIAAPLDPVPPTPVPPASPEVSTPPPAAVTAESEPAPPAAEARPEAIPTFEQLMDDQPAPAEPELPEETSFIEKLRASGSGASQATPFPEYADFEATAPVAVRFPEADPPPQSHSASPPSRGSARRRGRRALLPLLALAVIVVGGGGALLFLGRDAPSAEGAAPTPQDPPSSAATQPEGQGDSPTSGTTASGATGPHQRASLALASVLDPSNATALAATLTEAAPNHLFYTAPVEVNGQLFFRVMGGLALDSLGDLRQTLSAATGRDGSDWVFRDASLAFDFGEYPELTVARQREGELRQLGVPAYTLALDAPEGAMAYRVYAGGYADAAEARGLRGLITTAGVEPPSLTARLGRLPN